MDAQATSNTILKKLAEEFDINTPVPNQEYLESQLNRLQRMVLIYKTQSSDAKLSGRQRARARDLEQAANGMINGIKFSISFWLHKDTDLMELEKVTAEPGLQKHEKNVKETKIVNWRVVYD